MYKQADKDIIYSFLGAPGAGKGTLARVCVDQLGFEAISVGNLCRKHVAIKSDLGLLIKGYLQRDCLIPDELIVSIVEDWFLNKINLGKPIVLDGFPRTVGQVKFFFRFLNDLKRNYEFRVFNIIISEDDILSRLQNRVVCENKDCQSVYSSYDLDTCSLCGGSLIKRGDDQLAIIKKRLNNYPKYSKKLLDLYKSLGIRIHVLFVNGKTVREVFDAFKSFI